MQTKSPLNSQIREYPTITFAEKVKIGDKPGIMGVTVKITTSNFYEAHRILLPDGQIIEI